MQMHEGRYVWVNGRPKHVSQLNKLSMTQVVLTVMSVLCVFAMYYLSLAL